MVHDSSAPVAQYRGAIDNWHWDGRLEQPDVACDGLELVTGQPPHGSLYLRGLARDGVALRRRVHEILARQRQAWGLSPVDFGRYTNLFS